MRTMGKTAFSLFLVVLSGVIVYTIRANANREVTVIEVPEGNITIEVTEGVSSDHGGPGQYADTEVVAEVETIEVPEGLIIIRTEIVVEVPAGLDQSGKDPDVSRSGRLRDAMENCPSKIAAAEISSYDQTSTIPSVNAPPEQILQRVRDIASCLP